MSGFTPSEDERVTHAASDMLKVLEWIIGSPQEEAYWITQARAAVAKAKGDSVNELSGNSGQLVGRWSPIATVPQAQSVDIWIASEDNQSYGRRACHVAMVEGKWISSGDDPPNEKYGEFATHWMPMPKRPGEQA